MINNVNTVDLLKPKIMAMDNFSAATRTVTTTTTTKIPQIAMRSYATTCTAALAPGTDVLDSPDLGVKERQERVKVQHLENHAKLQNNCWSNFRTLCNLSATHAAVEADADADRADGGQRLERGGLETKTQTQTQNNNNNNNSSTNNFNIQSQSAFDEDYIDNRTHDKTFGSIETNNNRYTQNGSMINVSDQNGRRQCKATTMADDADTRHALPTQRTVDQENAFRRIESVHNYAKLTPYGDPYSPQGSTNSSGHDDDAEDESEAEEDEAEAEAEDYDNYVHTNYERFFVEKRKRHLVSGLAEVPVAKELESRKVGRRPDGDNDVQVDVDVETVETPTATDVVAIKPDHHARRPMNAFLIFCKRHRAIVKERYKSLENRAITKILGDWWASLDADDKKSFTSLAQQNKDAFFSANPNFKWYKLPAPPLRTLSTRPSNSGATGDEPNKEDGSTALRTTITTRSGNYFKLADEAQMGELSTLMQDRSKTRHTALQEALGETTHFLSTHMPTSVVESLSANEKTCKRRLYSENSFSSNSSEDDVVLPKKTKKNTRSCKGKIYQELVNSGQIAPLVKKSKSGSRLIDSNVAHGEKEFSHCLDTPNDTAVAAATATATAVGKDVVATQQRTVSESESLLQDDAATFDLEEKIKELPALSLDAYLQRKRNTKKKKKLTGSSSNRKRANVINRSPSLAVTDSLPTLTTTTTTTDTTPSQQATSPTETRSPTVQQHSVAVGSQKRKARKESITRRDVNAIESEVASLPLAAHFTTINGSCYFQATPIDVTVLPPQTQTAAREKCEDEPLTLNDPRNSVDVVVSSFNDNISPTSDLLILAEVAANRTELKH